MKNVSSNPLITVIIPTRERADTLLFAIKTALDQESDSYEVLVSDNFSQDNTKEVVQSFYDRRLVYVNTGRRLSMSDNWEFALERARGEYVVFIGDDDAVMPGAIDKLQTFIQDNVSLVYYWFTHNYIWPMYGKMAYVNRLVSNRRPFEVDMEKEARYIASTGGISSLYPLPTLYHGAVAKRLLDMIREQTGRVFHTLEPDFFIFMTMPAFTSKAVNVGYPVTVLGYSKEANSSFHIVKDGIAKVENYIQEYGDYKVHPALLFPGIPIRVILGYDVILAAMDKIPQFYGGVQFNYNLMWACLLRGAKSGGYEFNLKKILQERQHLQQYHLSLVRVVFYFVAYKFLSLCHRMLKKKKSMYSPESAPDNISDFVKQLEGARKGKEDTPPLEPTGCEGKGKFVRFIEFIAEFLLVKRVRR